MSNQTPETMSDEELLDVLLFHKEYEDGMTVKAEILRRMDPQRLARLEAIEKAARALIKAREGWKTTAMIGVIDTYFDDLRDFLDVKAEPQTNPPATHAPDELAAMRESAERLADWIGFRSFMSDDAPILYNYLRPDATVTMGHLREVVELCRMK